MEVAIGWKVGLHEAVTPRELIIDTDIGMV
jgi:hypothetical protein